jgi:hypothetical protein
MQVCMWGVAGAAAWTCPGVLLASLLLETACPWFGVDWKETEVKSDNTLEYKPSLQANLTIGVSPDPL